MKMPSKERNSNNITTHLMICLLLFFTLSTSYAQSCASQRYQRPVFDAINSYEDITYATSLPYASEQLGVNIQKDYKFDFYEPMNDPMGKRPLVMMFCGGDFQKGDKKNSEVQTWCDSLASYGFACAAINYRLGYNAKSNPSIERAIYRSVQDVRAAVRYFKEFHKTFKIDTNQIYLGGDEAGAVAILHAMFIENEDQRIRATFGIPNEKTDLGCLDCSGNPFQHKIDVAGLINMRGKVTSLDIINARKKIPMIHIEDELAAFDTRKNPLDQLSMVGSKALHGELDRLGYNTVKEDVALFNASSLTSSVQSSQIWNAAWKQISAFLYSTMRFVSPTPTGPAVACSGKPTTYKIDGKGSFCWAVTGGRIIEDNGNSIKVSWDYEATDGKIELQAINEIGVAGYPSALNVVLRETAIAEFDALQIEDNVISVQDMSSYGSFFMIDFGDGSSPKSAKPGERIIHTFDLKGNYVISQILENSCGTAISTQNVKVNNITIDSWAELKKAIQLPVSDIQLNDIDQDLQIPLSNQLIYPIVRIRIIESETEKKIFDQNVELACETLLSIPKNQLHRGKYTIKISADGQSVNKHFEVK